MRFELLTCKTSPRYQIESAVDYAIDGNFSLTETIGDEVYLQSGDLTFDTRTPISIPSGKYVYLAAYETPYSGGSEELIGIFAVDKFDKYDYKRRSYKYTCKCAQMLFVDYLKDKEIGADRTGLNIIFDYNEIYTNYPPVVAVSGLQDDQGSALAYNVFGFMPGNCFYVWWQFDPLNIGRFLLDVVNDERDLDGITGELILIRGNSKRIDTHTMQEYINYTFLNRYTESETFLVYNENYTSAFERGLKPTYKTLETVFERETGRLTWYELLKTWLYRCDMYMAIRPKIDEYNNITIDISLAGRTQVRTAHHTSDKITKNIIYQPDMYRIDVLNVQGENFEYSVKSDTGRRDKEITRSLPISNYDYNFDQTPDADGVPFFMFRTATATPGTAYDKDGDSYRLVAAEIAYENEGSSNKGIGELYNNPMSAKGYSGELLWDGHRAGDVIEIENSIVELLRGGDENVTGLKDRALLTEIKLDKNKLAKFKCRRIYTELA